MSHPVVLLAEYYPARWAALRGMKANTAFGISGGVMLTGQRQTLGNAIPVLLHYQGRLSRVRCIGKIGHNEGFVFNIGSGIAYWSRPFDLQTNAENSAIGSHITWALMGSLSYRSNSFLGHENSYCEVGVGIYHSSNGAFRLPNLGLNVPLVHASFVFGNQFQTWTRSADMHNYWYSRGLQLWASLAGGAKMADYAPSKLYGTYTGRVAGLWRVSARSGLTLGADWIHHGALKAEARFYNEPVPNDFTRIGIAAGHDWFIARGIALTTQVGWYVRNPAPGVHKPYYQRYGVRFNTAGRLSPAILLRSHLGQADAVEWTVAYRLN